jgi:hypothetical protein
VSTSSGEVSILVAEAPVSGLLAFEVDLASLRLVRADGTATDELLGGPGRVELLELVDRDELVAHVDVPEGTYVSARVRLDADGAHAKAPLGEDLPVLQQGEEFVAPLAEPLVVISGQRPAVRLRLDLEDSLDGSTPGGDLLFTPSADVSQVEDGEEPDLDELHGVVVAASAPGSWIQIDAFRGENLDVPVGTVGVRISPSTVLVDVGGTIFPAPESFFASLALGKTMVEVHGTLADGGVVDAQRIEILDQTGTMPPLVILQGVVADLVPGLGFRLLLSSVETGGPEIQPILDGSGHPEWVAIAVTPDTRYYQGANNPVPGSLLANGQHVRVLLQDLMGPPFIARAIDIEKLDVQYQGVVESIAGLPESIVVSLGGDWNSEYGDLADGGSVVVRIVDAHIELGMKPYPSLLPKNLCVGQKVRVTGGLQGFEGGTGIDASEVRVHPGRFIKGEVEFTSDELQAFFVNGAKVVQTFGDCVWPGDVVVVLRPETNFKGSVGSAEEFFAALEEGASIDDDDDDDGDDGDDDEGYSATVKVRGVATGFPGRVIGYEVHVKLHD